MNLTMNTPPIKRLASVRLAGVVANAAADAVANSVAVAAAIAVACASLLSASSAQAQFAASVTPPRFEVSVEPGQVSRQVLEISHAVVGTGVYRVYSNDWTLDAATGAVGFYDTLQPGSCRPWVTLERKEVSVTNGTRVRFRFEVAPPAGTTPMECRFALMVEGKPQEVKAGASVSIPMSGRLGVIVYVSVGGAKSALELGAISTGPFDGQTVPVMTVVNTGKATGRLAGIVNGKDAAGNTFEFSPETSPILPGQSRQIALQLYAPGRRAAQANAAAAAQPQIKWPLTLRGTLEYGSGAGPAAGDSARIELDRAITVGGR